LYLRIQDLEDTLVAELIQFVAFMRTQKPASANESAKLIMYKLLSSLNLCQTFPNVELAVRIYVHDGVQCLRRAELLKVGNCQRRAEVLNGSRKT